MEALVDFFSGFLSNEADVRRMIMLVVAATMFVFGLGLSILVATIFDPVRRRLGILGPRQEDNGDVRIRIATALGPIAQYALPKQDEARNKVQQSLTHAGIRFPQALQTFYAIKALLTIILFFVVMLVSRFLPDIPSSSVVMYSMIGASVGLLGPNYVLHRMVATRQKLLRNAFPDALDLLVVCVESGLGLGPALQRVAEELAVSHPELSFELATVNAEMRAGIARETALRNLATRTGVSDIRGLVGLLVQSMRFGTSVADALRVYSEEFRDKRMQAAEEQAAKMSTKLIFPLVLCMFPVFFIVAIGPAILRIFDAFISPNAGL